MSTARSATCRCGRGGRRSGAPRRTGVRRLIRPAQVSDEGGRVASIYGGARYQRLQQLKAKYDLQNVFCLNVNIAPVV